MLPSKAPVTPLKFGPLLAAPLTVTSNGPCAAWALAIAGSRHRLNTAQTIPVRNIQNSFQKTLNFARPVWHELSWFGLHDRTLQTSLTQKPASRNQENRQT